MAQTTNTGITLTDVTYVGRQTVKFGALFLVFLIVGRTLWGAFITYWKATHPPAPPPPTVGFGLLPAIDFPTQIDDDKPVSYVLETSTGTTPVFGDRAKVFFMPPTSPSLLADQEAKKIAAQYGFMFSPEVLSSREYRWTKSQPLESSFELDIQSLAFALTTNYLSRPELVANNELPTETNAVNVVKQFLGSADLLPPDMSTASGKVTYLRALGSEVQPAVSYSDADFVQVDLNRTPIDNIYAMYTPDGTKGLAHAVLTGALSGPSSVVEMEFHYQSVDYSEFHTYPLRTSQTAWKLLQAGEGYIAERGLNDQAVIREVYLGYFNSFDEQEYLQPIYVFEGDNGFLGYVPAIDPRYIQTATE